ncbi:type 1 glutamine amidotransferase [Halomonas sp. YLGW01]|uniref:type 1 glutamine amidotransferase n=1 Tax=Halomonas sp. YLGW01 TaxID=2773308 RepID=UPI0017814D95|nr:type 1 glutamine amidotransferase [Halomonas sp. YLGW01]
MHTYFLQQAEGLGPARFADWLDSMGHSHNTCHLYADETPPRLEDCDGLILLDADLAVDDTASQPWLGREKKLLARALKSGKPVLGVGLGARLIAESLGAIVSRGTSSTLGWQHITLAPESPFDLPETFEAFSWHRDIVGLPDDALPLGGSAASPQQGFAWDWGRVVALQCHLEATEESLSALLTHLAARKNGAPALAGPHVQAPEAILADARRLDRQAALLDRLLVQWLRSVAR